MTRNSPLVDHRATRWFLALSGVALLTAQATLPTMSGDAPARIATVAAHRGAVTASAVAFLAAGILLQLATLALNTVPLVRARRAVTVGAVLTAIGALWPVAGRAAYNLVMVAIAGGADRRSAAGAADAIDNSAALGFLLLTLLAFVLGPVVLSLGLWRAGVVPAWPALLWFVGVLVVNAAEDSSRAVAALGMLGVAAALARIGAAISGIEVDQPEPLLR